MKDILKMVSRNGFRMVDQYTHLELTKIWCAYKMLMCLIEVKKVFASSESEAVMETRATRKPCTVGKPGYFVS